ncbi:hypothetical protein COU54_04735 [Candidatus Pacearchaeota archaeon CG10_big_fil_rev_8_21_14_0_10_31_24]|nr:MAG: hypothetical protein COU54_04735 [Candidatus Pacearchaeota archaeon CG10_big_fil_rev_8_21_14_0_10_31_24]
MPVIGFNFTKISATRFSEPRRNSTIDGNMEFKDITTEKNSILNSDNEVLKLSFKFGFTYFESEDKKNKLGELAFEGDIFYSTTKEESKEILKSWKKKTTPKEFSEGIYTLILRKCTVKALDLEDQVGLPPHLQLPKVGLKTNQN